MTYRSMATYNTINNQQRHVPNLRQTSHHCPRARHHHLTILRPSTLCSILHHIVLVSSLPDRSCKTRSVAPHNVSAVAAIGICLWTDSINAMNAWVCRTNKHNFAEQTNLTWKQGGTCTLSRKYSSERRSLHSSSGLRSSSSSSERAHPGWLLQSVNYWGEEKKSKNDQLWVYYIHSNGKEANK